MPTPPFPLEVKKGSAVVKVYRTPVKVKRKVYDAYTVKYYADGKPVQKKFADPDKAIEHANAAAESIDSGQLSAFLFSEREKAIYHRADEALRPYGKSVDVACLEYAELLKEMNGVSPREAIRFYRRQHPENFQRRTVSEVFTELIAFKEQDKVSEYWLRDLNTRLGKFKKQFGNLCITEITGIQLEDWLRGLKTTTRSRKNYHTCLSVFFNFAKKRRYLPRDHSEMELVTNIKYELGAIEIYTPGEMKKLLLVCPKKHVPYLALGGFAGVRTAEIQRMEWPDINFKAGMIEIKAENAKTAARRLIPLLPNLATWLTPLDKGFGNVWTLRDSSDLIDKIEEGSKIKWRKNALRHSFISYRLAIVKSAAQVALEAGTSERKIFSNYRELVTEEAAKEWFAITNLVAETFATSQTPAKSRKTVK